MKEQFCNNKNTCKEIRLCLPKSNIKQYGDIVQGKHPYAEFKKTIDAQVNRAKANACPVMDSVYDTAEDVLDKAWKVNQKWRNKYDR